MMRSESTSALGQPSETKEIFDAISSQPGLAWRWYVTTLTSSGSPQHQCPTLKGFCYVFLEQERHDRLHPGSISRVLGWELSHHEGFLLLQLNPKARKT